MHRQMIAICLALSAGIANAALFSTPQLSDHRRTHYDEHGALVVPVSDSHITDLYTRWGAQSVSAVISALATRELKRRPARVRRKFEECAKGADGVTLHAKCLSRLWNGELDGGKVWRMGGWSERLRRFGKAGGGEKFPRLKRLQFKNPNKWIGSFRTRQRRSIRHQEGYDLKGTDLDKSSPLRFIARGILKSVLNAKNRTHGTSWQEIVERAQKLKLAKAKNKFGDAEEFKRFRGLSPRLSQLNGLDKRPKNLNDDDGMSQLVESALAEGTASDTAPKRLMKLFRDGVRLGYSLAGQNISNFDRKSIRMISPRFLSLLPDADNGTDTINLISPSLFSLHESDDKLENLTSLTNLLRNAGIDDQQAWLDLIVEATGLEEQLEKVEMEAANPQLPPSPYEPVNVQEALKLYQDNAFTKDHQPLYFTRENASRIYGEFGTRRIDHWLDFQKTFSDDQIREMNSTGFVLMSTDQIHHIYGAHSPFNDSSALQRFTQMDAGNFGKLLNDDIHHIAKHDDLKLQNRQKDVVLSPIFFALQLGGISLNNPAILSPLVFSPLVLHPTILGPLILSPWIFTPLVLAPKILSPIIVSPFIFSPTILSPYCLHPTILSPGIFNPFILSPTVLGPNILSPQAFSPKILNPTALSPAILSPSLGSPSILSPFVLSPAVVSPQILGALVLSPYALSPVVYSKLYAFVLILSPSWLS